MQVRPLHGASLHTFRRARQIAACLVFLLLAVPAWAQQPTAPAAPTLAALDAARLQILELAIENLTLKLDALKREAETFVRTLQREGYELRKENGQWVYRPTPIEPPSTTPPPPPRQE